MHEEELDPDLAGDSGRSPSSSGSPRPGLRGLGMLALVCAGGAAGTWVRAVLEAAVGGQPPTWPWATFAVNVSGAFLLGCLLELLARSGSDAGWRRGVRLAAGTGFLGGYTTYSALAVEVVLLTFPAPHLHGAGYALTSVVLGSAAAAAGFLVGQRVRVPPGRGRAT